MSEVPAMPHPRCIHGKLWNACGQCATGRTILVRPFGVLHPRSGDGQCLTCKPAR